MLNVGWIVLHKCIAATTRSSMRRVVSTIVVDREKRSLTRSTA